MFPKDTKLGRLSLGEVFIDYEGPQLFACDDEQGRHLIAVHAPATVDGDNWLYVYISAERLKRIGSGSVSLRQTFFMPESGEVFRVTFVKDGVTRADGVNPSEIPNDWYPDAGERLGDWSEARIVDDEPDLAGAIANVLPFSNGLSLELRELPLFLQDPAPMWEISPELLKFLHTKRTPVSEVAKRTGRSVIDLVFKTPLNRNEMSAAVLGRLLLTAQGTVDALAPPFPPGVKGAAREARLDVLPVFPGSFGLRLDTHEAMLFPNPRLVVALQRLVALFASATNPLVMREQLAEYGPKAAFRFRHFAKAIEKSESDVFIQAGIPDENAPLSANLPRDEIMQLVKFLDVEANQTQDTFSFKGLLVGFILKTKFFALENDDRVVSGRVAETAANSMIGKKIGDQYIAEITEITDINEATGEERVRNILTSLK